MTILEQENSVACECEAAWRVLADFGNFLAWATGGAGAVRLEGEGVGMIRHLDIPGLGRHGGHGSLFGDGAGSK